MENISKVGQKWPELVPQFIEISPSLFQKLIPIIHDRALSTRINTPERIRIAQMLEELFSAPTSQEKEFEQLLAAFTHLFSYDDVKVREGGALPEGIFAKFSFLTASFFSNVEGVWRNFDKKPEHGAEKRATNRERTGR